MAGPAPGFHGPVESAHNILFHLVVSEGSPMEAPEDAVIEFREWSDRNGYDGGGLNVMHVHSIQQLDERTAELVVMWAKEVYPDIFK